jgi:hypothetical protein
VAKRLPKILKEIKKHTPKVIDYSENNSVSYSQFSMYKTCPYKWALTYKDKNKTYKPSIHTVFGKAFHETVQDWLKTMYDVAGTVADKMDLNDKLYEEMIFHYSDEKKSNNGEHFTTSSELDKFYNDGVAILEYIKKNRSAYFSKRGWHLVGIELPLVVTPHPEYPSVLYKGFLDFVLYDEKYDSFYIFDIKTSTGGWNDYAKKDEIKQFQLILYKQFFAQEFNIDVEKIHIQYFIVRRKINENALFPPKRVQEFVPASGKSKMNKALSEMQKFIEDCFETNGKIQQKEYPKNPGKHCSFCPFNETPLCNKLRESE